MNRKRMTALAALQLLVALAVGPHVSSEAHAFNAAASGPASLASSKSNPSSVQRRRPARRRRAADPLLPGFWGGDHVRFEVTESGATIEYDCAHAKIEGKILVDAAGRFSVAGTYYREHGGPVRKDEASHGRRVRLDGRIGGSLMTLKVTRAGRTLDTHTLTRDREAQLFKCR